MVDEEDDEVLTNWMSSDNLPFSRGIPAIHTPITAKNTTSLASMIMYVLDLKKRNEEEMLRARWVDSLWSRGTGWIFKPGAQGGVN